MIAFFVRVVNNIDYHFKKRAFRSKPLHYIQFHSISVYGLKSHFSLYFVRFTGSGVCDPGKKFVFSSLENERKREKTRENESLLVAKSK